MPKAENKNSDTLRTARICTYCGIRAELVWVHGHGQCSHCGTNVEECCSGEQCTVRGTVRK